MRLLKLPWTITADVMTRVGSRRRRCASHASSTTYRARMNPYDGRVVSEFITQALPVQDLDVRHIYLNSDNEFTIPIPEFTQLVSDILGDVNNRVVAPCRSIDIVSSIAELGQRLRHGVRPSITPASPFMTFTQTLTTPNEDLLKFIPGTPEFTHFLFHLMRSWRKHC
ncbi:hypothetical protein EDB89DRAFT_2066634 [Lactarius sanguifluus]|nr:hypothetical protein EDB89DRAFT_2066634 [Lactarius sanguifluus]